MIKNSDAYLNANWTQIQNEKPDNIHAVTTLRSGGFSKATFNEFNLANHVSDEINAVTNNRAKLVEDLQLSAEPVWLEQVHSNKVICADDVSSNVPLQADASFSRKKGVVCAVLTADCLPVFFCNRAGSEVAVAHAGWRGLHAGILSNTVAAMESVNGDILVSLGPAIGPQAFEVGVEVFKAFVEKNSDNEAAFSASKNGRYLCDMYQLARIELLAIGITQVAGGEYCTYSDAKQFYSYRRSSVTGRMASVIWLT